MGKRLQSKICNMTEKLTKFQVNSACWCFFYQEQIPKGAVERYKNKRQ